MPVRYGLSEH